MLKKLDLGGTWKVRGFDGQHGWPHQYFGETADERTFIPAQVPGEIHLDLEKLGWIEDSNLGTNAQKNRWVEEQVWVYRHTFKAPADAVEKPCWLVFEGLDITSEIYLNGEKIGEHNDIFWPCRIPVTGKLRAGENQLTVCVESGLHYVSEKPGIAYQTAQDHKLHKRSWLRKPQSTFSWDWSPRLLNVGIYKPVRLEWTDSLRLDQVTVFPRVAEGFESAEVHVRAFVENATDQTVNAKLRVKIPEASVLVEQNVELEPGCGTIETFGVIENPRLWYPIPHGEQPLYVMQIELETGGQVVDSAERKTGIRTITINQDEHPEGGNYFSLVVNGKPIFAKGGNWVPPDVIVARCDDSHYRKLVELAVEANFNALRIWGGGLYAHHALLEACDELGVLVWHDFIFACSKYPGDDPEFLGNIRNEVTWNVRDLSHHPSLVVWCGNNELEWGTWEWGYDKVKAYPDYALYHHEIPRIVKKEDPSRPYWPSSPYSTDNRPPNDKTTGDQHPWSVSLQDDGPNFWAYRGDVSRFPNEGGILGASSPATLKQFIPEGERHLFSPTWEFHDNAANYWGVGGICYRTFQHWTGRGAAEVSFEDYCFYSALLQSEGLQEYSNNFRRRMFSSSSAIFWMYNDCWPTSHGWTIVDYYLRRKLSYHPVRRAFQPVFVVPVVEGNRVLVMGVNDTLENWTGEVRYGLFALAGGLPKDETATVTLAANAGTLLGEFALEEWEKLGTGSHGAFAMLTQEGHPVAQNRLFIANFKDMEFQPGDIRVERKGKMAVFSADVFVWGVTLNEDGDKPLADDVFDLLPGIPYQIPWPEDKPLPKVERRGSPLPW